MHRYLSESQEKFYTILHNFEHFLPHYKKKPLFILTTGHFDVRGTVGWKNYILTSESIRTESTISSYGLSQIISDTIYIFLTSLACIDIIFSNQSNLFIENGVHNKLYTIIAFINLSKTTLKIHPPLY